VAAGAALGPVLDQLIDGFDGRQMTPASRMARLGALATLRGRRPPTLRGPRRIQAGGQRGVARVSAQALLELGDARRKLRDLFILPGDLCRQRQKHGHDGLAALLVDRLRLGALHAQGIRDARVSACPSPSAGSAVSQADRLNAYDVSWTIGVNNCGTPDILCEAMRGLDFANC
jgi:hypothetical protein